MIGGSASPGVPWGRQAAGQAPVRIVVDLRG
jgi:hypothetical protein